MSELFKYYLSLAMEDDTRYKHKQPIAEKIATVMVNKAKTSKQFVKRDAPVATESEVEPGASAPEEKKEKESPAPEEESDKAQPEEDEFSLMERRKITILAWLKKLNTRFKPIAKFKLIIEEDDKGNEDMYISLKPYNGKFDRHFYHIALDKKLTKDVLKKIITIADRQLREVAAANEEVVIVKNPRKREKKYVENLSIRGVHGWKKTQNKQVIAEFEKQKKKRNEPTIFMEILSPTKPGTFKNINGYTIILYDAVNMKPIKTVKNIENELKLSATALKLMKTMT